MVLFCIGRSLAHKRILYSGDHQDVSPPNDNHANSRPQFSLYLVELRMPVPRGILCGGFAVDSGHLVSDNPPRGEGFRHVWPSGAFVSTRWWENFPVLFQLLPASHPCLARLSQLPSNVKVLDLVCEQLPEWRMGPQTTEVVLTLI